MAPFPWRCREAVYLDALRFSPLTPLPLPRSGMRFALLPFSLGFFVISLFLWGFPSSGKNSSFLPLFVSSAQSGALFTHNIPIISKPISNFRTDLVNQRFRKKKVFLHKKSFSLLRLPIIIKHNQSFFFRVGLEKSMVNSRPLQHLIHPRVEILVSLFDLWQPHKLGLIGRREIWLEESFSY